MTHKPTDQLLESISAMVDGEASDLEFRRVLKSLDDSDSTLQHWHRYHLMGAAMRKESHVDCSVNLLGAISAEIYGTEADSAATTVSPSFASSKSQKSKWKLLVGQSMVAASVAATFVLSFHLLGNNDTGQPSMPQFANSEPMETELHNVASSVPIGFDLPIPEARVVSGGDSLKPQPKLMQQSNSPSVRTLSRRYNDDLGDIATQQLLDQLLIEHAGRASVNGSLGLMPFARVSKMGASE